MKEKNTPVRIAVNQRSGFFFSFGERIGKYYPTPEKGGTKYSRSTFTAHAEPIFKQLKILNLNNIYRFRLGRLCFCLR